MTYEQGAELAKKEGFDFIEASAADRTNIDELFDMMVDKVLPQVKKRMSAKTDNRKTLNNTKVKKGKKEKSS